MSSNPPAPSAPSAPSAPPAPSAPSAPTAPAAATNTANTATGGTAATGTGNTTVTINTSHSAVSHGGVAILERRIDDSSWPSDLVLDLGKTNWLEWSRRLTLLVDRLYVSGYLDGSLSCPDETTDATAHHIWTGNDKSLRAFILERVSPEEYDIASSLGSAHATFEGLRTRHEKLGLHAQINLLRKALDITYLPGVSMLTTSKEIRNIYDRLIKMGKIEGDQLLTIIIVNALGKYYSPLQSTIHGLTDDAGFTSLVAFKRIETEAALEDRRAELGIQNPSMALVAANTKGKSAEIICSNCKCPHHSIEFCVRPGGGMAGRSTDEAKAAQRAAAGKPPRTTGKATTTSTANIAATTTTPIIASVSSPSTTTTTTSSAMSVSINGVSYMLTPTPAPIAAPTTATTTVHSTNFCDHTGSLLEVNDLIDFEAYIVENGSLSTSLNWDDYSKVINLSEVHVHSISGPNTGRTDNLPFILDSGATCHISPECSDFKTLRAIPPSPIKGFQGTSISTIGMGTMELSMPSGQILALNNVLFVPAATVRLVSVVALNRDHQYITYFDSDACYVATKTGSIIARGTVSPTRNLYTLTIPSFETHTAQASHYAARTPTVETWHRRLGHCNVRTVIDMARNNVAKGMPIDLSSAPPKCNECIIGKQARSSVPKVREGSKATRRLERVFVDLCSPMHVPSKTGRLYSMNVIDDYSSYVWSVRLKSKDEAALALRVWHNAVVNQCGEKLKILVTDNGELLTHTITSWCAELGIEHQLTAPYTSAHNGRVERLHRTLMDKCRTMRLACNAPPFLWDEFYATATYLTTLTASSSIGGRTPFELWFGHPPSLSHLREIGCRAFALISTHNPKILQRSVPCILIGYAPHAKAYRLWNPSSHRIFNTFHITFVEHLDSQPSDLLPGTLLNVGDHSLPPSWDVASHDTTPTSPPTPSLNVPITIPHSSFNNPSFPSLSPVPSTISSNPNNVISNTVNTDTSNTNTVNTNTVNTNTVNTNSVNTNTVNTNTNNITNTNPLSTIPRSHSSLPPPNPIPPLCRSSRIPIPNSRFTRNGLAPDSRLAAALSDVAASARRRQEEHPTRRAELDDQAHALLSEFAPVRDTHHLIPIDLGLDIPDMCPSVDAVLSAIADGSMEPVLDSGDDPSWADALASPDREYWIAGGCDELKSLKDLNVFVLVPRSEVPRGQKPLKGKLVCKRKRDDAGNIVRYKVRYVAKGYAQRYGVDYDKTTAPTVRLESFRTILHIAATLGWDLQHVDVKTAFLHGVLPESETMFMEQPPGFEAPGKET